MRLNTIRDQILDLKEMAKMFSNFGNLPTQVLLIYSTNPYAAGG